MTISEQEQSLIKEENKESYIEYEDQLKELEFKLKCLRIELESTEPGKRILSYYHQVIRRILKELTERNEHIINLFNSHPGRITGAQENHPKDDVNIYVLKGGEEKEENG